MRVVRAAVLLLALLGVPAPARAGQPAWLQGALASGAPATGADEGAVVVFQRTELELDANLHARIHEVRALRILKSSGLEAARYAVQLRPGAILRNLQTWALDAHGRSSEAGRKEAIETMFRPGEYTDTRMVSVRPPDVRVGDVVAVDCAYEETLPFATWAWWPQPAGMAVGRAELSLRLPKGWRAVIHPSRVVPGDVARGEAARELSAGPLPKPPDEPSSPPLFDRLPSVRIAFIDPAGQRGFGDWSAVARWYFDLSAPAFDARQVPADLLGRASNCAPEAAVSALARAVQRSVNYAAIELGNRAWVPDRAPDTWTRRYGDCKDMATLLVAALSARGVVARPALTCTRGMAAIDPAAPDPGQFNHCIVALLWPGPVPPAAISAAGPSGRVWTFFDPTATDMPFGMLPSSDAGAWAVIADTAEGLVRLPTARGSTIANHVVAHLEDDGTLAGIDTVTADGEEGARIAHQLGAADDAQRRARVARLFETSWATPEILGVRALAGDSARFVTSIEVAFRLAGAAQRAGRSWVVRPLFLRGEHAAPPPDTSRTLPYVLHGPARFTDRFELATPQGYEPEAMPEISWSGAIGEYRLVQDARPGQVGFSRTLVLRDEQVPAADYANVRRLKSVVYSGDTAAFVLRPGE